MDETEVEESEGDNSSEAKKIEEKLTDGQPDDHEKTHTSKKLNEEKPKVKANTDEKNHKQTTND